VVFPQRREAGESSGADVAGFSTVLLSGHAASADLLNQMARGLLDGVAATLEGFKHAAQPEFGRDRISRPAD